MHVSNTFSILFWLHTAKQKDNLAPIYARITVNGKRTEISLKRTVSVTSWDSSKNRVTGRTDRVKSINSFLDQTHAKLQDCYSQLQSELKLITAQSIKARFLGADENHKTLLELIKYHNTNMNGTIKRGTMKNYFSTEKYLKKFLLKKIKSNDIYLKHISYSFIVDFETFLKTAPTLNKHQPLSNNGIMKHLERLKKLINLALKLEWIDKDPFARYSLKFIKFDRVYLNKEELEQLEGTSFKNTTHQKTRDIFVFACYTGLSYADIKTLTSSHIVRGINGEYWIYTRREKSNTSVKVPLLGEEIEGFLYELITKSKISESYQNQLINAIKAYYEHALKMPREYYDIQRPKRAVSIPNVLSKSEVLNIIQSPKNIKHRAILHTIYGSGLRISELLNLRVADVHSDQGYLFIKDSKGKKDRKTILPEQLLVLLRAYYKAYKPSYWLFEGQTGGKYSTASIRSIFRKAVDDTNSNPWATVHTLRHSFATHCIENNINIRHLQNMLGHNSPKTTEIYTKTIEINNKTIISPLDTLLKNNILHT